MNALSSRSALLALVFAAALASVPSARAWGCKGHQTVALIAEKHLTSEARQVIRKLLTENPIDPELKRYCGSSIGDSWSDQVEESANMMQLRLYAGPAYQEAAAPVVQKQIELAGVRLAMILNEAAKPSPAEN